MFAVISRYSVPMGVPIECHPTKIVPELYGLASGLAFRARLEPWCNLAAISMGLVRSPNKRATLLRIRRKPGAEEILPGDLGFGAINAVHICAGRHYGPQLACACQ